MARFNRLWVSAAGTILLGASAFGQNIISAHSGLVNYSEGDVYLQDKLVEITPAGKFPEMKTGDVLRSRQGRAEVLLNPGAVLRMKEMTAVEMVSNKLSDTRVRVTEGSVIVEAADLPEGNHLTIAYKDVAVELPKKALIRVDASAGNIKVYEGEAMVARKGELLTLKSGKFVNVATMLPDKFDAKETDEFYRWAYRRAGALAAANIAGAKMAQGLGYSNSAFGGSTSSWFFVPTLGMYTYLPYDGRYMNVWGFPFYSAGVIDYYYNPYMYTMYNGSRGSTSGSAFHSSSLSYNPSLGYDTGSRGAVRSFDNSGYSGYSNVGTSSVPATSTTTTTAGPSRGSIGGGGASGSGNAGRGGR